MKRTLIVLAALLVQQQPNLTHAQEALGAPSAPVTALPASTAFQAQATPRELHTGSESIATPSRVTDPRAPGSTSWQALKGGLLGGAIGGIVSAALNYYVLPLPDSGKDNAIGHGMTGFMCGLVSGFIGVILYARNHSSGEDAK